MECHNFNKHELVISELREVSNTIFDHIEKTLSIASIPLTEDLYYEVQGDQKYNISTHPPEYSIGQLSDDLKFLKAIASDKSRATPLSLMHLAPILEYMATKINWYDPKLKD